MALVSDDPIVAVVDIRLFDPARDADRVAAFYNEEGYGPIASGRSATARIILDILAERAVKLFVVAEQRGRIVGTLGYARMSGRRVAPDGQFFAVMFLVAPSLRAGFLVARLFSDSFERFAALGARSLRVEVDPANRRALPLYVRIGFRVVGDGRPDEEGYLELVNHLPGVAAALRAEHALREGVPHYDAQTIREARRQTLTSGVGRDRTGARTISYDLEIDGRAVRAVTHADTGEILSATVDGQERDGRRATRDERPVGSAAEAIRSLSGGFRIILQTSDGTLRVEHPMHLGALVVDPFPVAEDTPAGVRRPAVRALTSTVDEACWVSTDGEIVRTVTFARRTVEVTVTHLLGETVVIYPWSGFRAATLTVASPSEDTFRSARYIRGVWPRDFTDFEVAAADVVEAENTRATWLDIITGLQVGIEVRSPGQWRIEGPHLSRVHAGASLRYRYVLEDAHRLPVAVSATNGPRREVAASPADTSSSAAAPRTRGGLAGRCSVDIDPSEGVVRWRVGAAPVFDELPSSRGFGPLSAIRSPIWFALQPSRHDPDLGAEWATPDARLGYGKGTSGWWLEPQMDARLLLRAHARRASTATSELVTYLAIPTAEVDLWDPTAGWVSPGRTAPSWRAWTQRCRVSTPRDDVEIDSVAGLFPEILVRRGPFGVLIAMFSQIDPVGVDVAWQLRLVERRPNLA